jgi:hypothetical protein
MILKALSDDGVVVDSALPRSQWRKRAKQRHALLHNLARGLQRIGEDAASGHKDAYGPMLRVLQLTHDVFTPTKDEQNGYGLGGTATRVRAPSAAAGSARASAARGRDGGGDRRRACTYPAERPSRSGSWSCASPASCAFGTPRRLHLGQREPARFRTLSCVYWLMSGSIVGSFASLRFNLTAFPRHFRFVGRARFLAED